MQPSDVNVRRTRESCAHSALVNALAVRRQVQRLREFDVHDPFEGARRQADAEFLLLALWRLRTSAAMALDVVEARAAVEDAIAGFDAAFPHLKSARHVLMHVDNYLLENDQRRNTRADSWRPVGRADVISQHNSPDGISWLGQDYWFESVTRESEHLYRTVTEALETPGFG